MNGVTFHTIHSRDFILCMVSDNRGIFSAVSRKMVQVPLLHGSVDFGLDTYNEQPLKVTFSYNFHNDVNKLRLFARDIRGWLYNDGNYYDLIFDDEPDRKYKAKVVNAIDLSQTATKGSFSVEFLCNPPNQFLLDNTPVTLADEQARLLWDTATLDGIQYLQEFTTSYSTMRFTNGGSAAVKPIIKLIGKIPNGTLLTLGTQNWQYSSSISNDSIIIDCQNETVKRGSDGANIFGSVNSAMHDFFVLPSGQIEISVTAIGVGVYPNSLIVAVEFLPQEVV